MRIFLASPALPKSSPSGVTSCPPCEMALCCPSYILPNFTCTGTAAPYLAAHLASLTVLHCHHASLPEHRSIAPAHSPQPKTFHEDNFPVTSAIPSMPSVTGPEARPLHRDILWWSVGGLYFMWSSGKNSKYNSFHVWDGGHT